jgi:outer membrane receptor protein involved in Fe transport
MNLRLSYSQSVARPEFRELAPATFPKIAGERERRGNPDLVQTDIASYDIRWEWFFSPLELVSAGFFYKDLSGPIEQVTVIIGTDPVDTWVNGGDATLYGFEVEGRKDFAFVNERLRPLSLMVNGSWADSSVDIPQQQFFGLTTLQSSGSRRLVGQSPFIVNAAVEWSETDKFTARMLYFTAAQSIASAGFNGLDDIEFQRRDQLDAVFLMPLQRYTGYPLTLRLSAENILNSPYVYTQGSIVQEKYTTGVKFTVGLTLTQ